MIYENVELSGSLDISGSFQVPYGISGSEPNSPSSGSLFFNTTDEKLYVWEGSWEIVGTQVQPPAIADIEYLVVAGGGGGGSMGGGGGGGLLSSSLSSIESGSSITVTVGAGGSGQIEQGGATPNSGTDSSIASSTGTSFTTVTSTGGGKGGGSSTAAAQTAGDGGSGGGGAGLDTSGPGGSGTVGQGSDGGDGLAHGTRGSGGGGGGAGEAGANAVNNTTGGDGGDGKQSSITGTTTYYAGGGGGGSYLYGGTGNSSSPGQGGATGGQSNSGYSSNGTANTGGGAGSGGFKSTGWQAGSGAGGSGVVVLAYPSSSIDAVGGIVGDAGNGKKYHQFNQSGTFKVGSTSDFGIVTDNLVSHYDAGNFSSRGTSTWTDLENNAYNGTVSGATLGNNFYYDFTGNAYITTGINHSSYSTLSYDVWVYITSATAGNIVGGANQSNRHKGMFSTKTTQIDYISIGQDFMRNSSLSLSDGWHHFVVTDAGSTDGATDAKIYIDGSASSWSVINNGYSGTRTNTNLQLGRGTRNTGAFDYGFEDKIAQFRFYSDVLTAAEVLQNYNATKTNFV